ncbi:MAG: nickel pincer cofactor biosynthesis protein LarC [Lachnospiraceae bacterium]|nr:nickel pincer cofactor biosynthesis protein LarC [Lachnospiraceae bacterium]
MRELYLDCAMGAAGDMLTAALLELTEDPDAALAALNGLGIPGVTYIRETSVKCGITGTHMRVLTAEGEEGDEHGHEHHHDHEHSHEHAHHHEHHHEHHEHEHNHEHVHSHEHDHHHHDHDHPHSHGHHHRHVHRSMADIAALVDNLAVSEAVKGRVLDVYRRIADAESLAHGVPVTEIHFHEVGMMDALADITAVCYLMETLKIDHVVASPVHVGSGTVACAHGVLPVPAPATATILKDVPIYGGDVRGELCTPTGAALLTAFADDFGAMPPMKIQKIGYGMGKKDFDRMNGVRAVLGNACDTASRDHDAEFTAPDSVATTTGAHGPMDRISELQCNLDDMTAEEIGFALDCLYEAGVLEAFVTPVLMKKNRQGALLTALCPESKEEDMARLIFRCTESLGIRVTKKERCILERRTEVKDTAYGPVREKIAEGWGVTRHKTEYDDVCRLAKEVGCSLREMRQKLAHSKN